MCYDAIDQLWSSSTMALPRLIIFAVSVHFTPLVLTVIPLVLTVIPPFQRLDCSGSRFITQRLRCLLWANSVVLNVAKCLPLHPNLRTISEPNRTSLEGHLRSCLMSKQSSQ